MKDFTMVPNWLLSDETITRSELLVLIALAHFHFQGAGEVFPSHRTIAKKARLCEKSVRETLKTLSAKGLVDWEVRTTTKGGATSHGYRLRFLSQVTDPLGTDYRPPRYPLPTPLVPSTDEEDPHEEDPLKKMVWSSPQAATTPRCFASHEEPTLRYVLSALQAVGGLEDLDLDGVHDFLDNHRIRYPDRWVDSLQMQEAQVLSWLTPYLSEE